MRLATWNVEWFDNLFDNRGRLHDDDRWSGRRDVTRADQTAAIAHVLRRINADAVMVIEAPDTSRNRDGVRALETFAETFSLRARAAIMGFTNDTQQEIALLFDPDALAARHAPGGDNPGTAPPFDSEMRIDLDIDGRLDTVTWSKPPLELVVTPRDGAAFRMIGVHAKSKAPHGARGRAAITRLSIENRRTQLAQCLWLRARVNELLAAGESLVVLGDLNDGPGLDEYEKLFNRSGVEIVLGNGEEVPLYDPHADLAFHAHAPQPPSTARFRKPHGHGHIAALLDFIMVSPDLRARDPVWRIWHPLDDPAIRAEPMLADALLTASDHFPVTLDFAVANPHLPQAEP
jgi:endonuclease/exonuclease/phosphatase family metal-dependent hydrolase